jgi:hypothetical protein
MLGENRVSAEATKFRSNRFGAIGTSSRLSVARIRYGRTMMARMPLVHQPLDLTAACPVALTLQFDMNRQTSLASVVVAMGPLDVGKEITIGGGSLLDATRSTASASSPP